MATTALDRWALRARPLYFEELAALWGFLTGDPAPQSTLAAAGAALLNLEAA